MTMLKKGQHIMPDLQARGDKDRERKRGIER